MLARQMASKVFFLGTGLPGIPIVLSHWRGLGCGKHGTGANTHGGTFQRAVGEVLGHLCSTELKVWEAQTRGWVSIRYPSVTHGVP